MNILSSYNHLPVVPELLLFAPQDSESVYLPQGSQAPNSNIEVVNKTCAYFKTKRWFNWFKFSFKCRLR